MNIKMNTIKLALLGTALAAVGALTSCCGSDPDPVATQPVTMEPMK